VPTWEGTLAPPGEYDWTCASLAHPSPHPKRQIDQFSHFCTAHGRKSLYFTIGDPFAKIAPSHRGSGPPSYSWFLRPFQDHSPKGMTIGSAVFTQVTPQNVPILYNGTPLSPSKLLLPIGGSGTHVIHGSLDPPESSTQTASRSVLPFLQGSLVWQTDRHRPRYAVSNSRQHRHSTAYGRCALIIPARPVFTASRITKQILHLSSAAKFHYTFHLIRFRNGNV